jgi:hypothetical protein
MARPAFPALNACVPAFERAPSDMGHSHESYGPGLPQAGVVRFAASHPGALAIFELLDDTAMLTVGRIDDFEHAYGKICSDSQRGRKTHLTDRCEPLQRLRCAVGAIEMPNCGTRRLALLLLNRASVRGTMKHVRTNRT